MATYYIDAIGGSDGTSDATNPATPRQTPPTLTANNTYRFKRGGTYTGAAGARLRPQSQVSAFSTPLTLEAYYNADGTDDETQPRPIFDANFGSNGVGAIFVDTCTNVVVRNLTGINSWGSLSGGVCIRRSDHVKILNCLCYDNTYGVSIYADTVACSYITISDCEAYDNRGSGFVSQWGTTSGIRITALSLLNNNFHDNGFGKYLDHLSSSITCGGITTFLANATAKGNKSESYRSLNWTVSKNIVADNYGYGIHLDHIGCSTIIGNEVRGSGISQDIDTHSLWLGDSHECHVLNNYVHHNFANSGASSGSGVGIMLDNDGTAATVGTAGSFNCVVRGNIVTDQWSGPTNVNPGSNGIHIYDGGGHRVSGNLILRCKNGIALAFGTGDASIVQHNTVAACTYFGIVHNTGHTNSIVRQNIVSDCDIGIYCATAAEATLTEEYNAVFGCATFARAHSTNVATTPYTSVTLGTGDITSDPLLTSGYRLTVSSPCKGAGTHVNYILDADGKQFHNPPSIGAYEYVEARTARV